jgi:hypothetical protein
MEIEEEDLHNDLINPVLEYVLEYDIPLARMVPHAQHHPSSLVQPCYGGGSLRYAIQ